MAIRAVWTDFGGVLTPPIEVTMAAFCRPMGLEPELLRRAMYEVAARYGTDVMAPLDTPLVSESEWSRQVEEVLRTEHGAVVDLSDFAAKWFTDRQVNEPWLARLAELRDAGYRIGVLSNMVPSWDEHWRRMVPVELFDEIVLSFQVGHRKPEPGIFRLAAERLGLRPEECLLVDDLGANCTGARAAGWHAAHFTGTAEALARLSGLTDAGGEAPADLSVSAQEGKR
ncbi:MULTISPECIES: HAD family hydrolase [unclassified Kitasatospora]|uniref:HAD family hydrolase n=1 Tax=unclassified Kitasatospora TaxID=2633591 RepID=UPI00382601EA